MPEFIEIASRVGTPLALAGVVASILFFVLREILRKRIFPQLTRGHSYSLLTLIVDRLFKLALVAVVLGFLGFLVTSLVASRSDSSNVNDLFRLLGATEEKPEVRLRALHTLRDDLGVRDFRKRNLSGLVLPSSGWENVDAREANLRGVTVRDASMRGVDLVRANLVGANVSGSDFRDAQLNGADLSTADCRNAIFTGVWLRAGRYRGADFSSARLDYANLEIGDFEGARFSDVDMSHADAEGANFVQSDLSTVRGLATAQLTGAEFNNLTRFPPGFSPEKNGMVRKP